MVEPVHVLPGVLMGLCLLCVQSGVGLTCNTQGNRRPCLAAYGSHPRLVELLACMLVRGGHASRVLSARRLLSFCASRVFFPFVKVGRIPISKRTL